MDIWSVCTGRLAATAWFRSSSMASSSSGADGLVVGEVEAQALRVHQGAGLLDVVAQVAPQDRLEEMGGGVVGA